LTFVFSPNDYFENTELEKTYIYQKELGYGGDFLYAKATGTEIKWKSEEKDLTKVVEVKKQRNKSRSIYYCRILYRLISFSDTNRTRLVKKTRPADSFFNFFSPPTPPANEEEEDNMNEEELADLEMKLEVDYQIGEDFKEKVKFHSFIIYMY
jgi:nucleosome assembly protein 1-like 1